MIISTHVQFKNTFSCFFPYSTLNILCFFPPNSRIFIQSGCISYLPTCHLLNPPLIQFPYIWVPIIALPAGSKPSNNSFNLQTSETFFHLSLIFNCSQTHMIHILSFQCSLSFFPNFSVRLNFQRYLLLLSPSLPSQLFTIQINLASLDYISLFFRTQILHDMEKSPEC